MPSSPAVASAFRRKSLSSPTDPGLVLFGSTRRRLLGWLFGHPDESFYLRDLLRQTGAPEGGAQRELAALTAAGLLTRLVRGRQVYFQANAASPVFPELLSLLTKTTGIVDVLRAALSPLAPKIVASLVFESAARGELKQGSDIDLLVIGDVSLGEVVDALADADRKLGRETNPVVYPADEFSRKARAGHHFLTALQNGPVLFVTGGRRDLESLGADQSLARRAPDVTGRDREPARRRRPRPARQPRGRSQR